MVSPPVAAVGDLRQEDVQSVRKLGEGAGGTVMLCRHVPSNTIMAKKSVPADPNPTVQRQIIRELRALRRCNSPYIVSFYGAYIEDDDIAICMEYCEGGSLDAIYKRIKTLDARIGEGVLGKVSEAVLNGLVYLHQLEIIHRDVKPSNILINGLGLIKLCDFGVSGELVDSVARTFLGTSYYMAPERIQGGGKGYKVSSDVWSLGLTIMEVAEGRFPFPPQGHRPLAMFELLDYVVTMPVPELGADWSDELRDFVRCCLRKDPNQRPTPKQMLTHRFVVQSSQQEVDLKTWINEVWA
ncbi:kinase-like domain-containing protein [Syncephalis fuscata]|nr:kinase-like domain-containing protein [Syncephalis fuscata]